MRSGLFILAAALTVFCVSHTGKAHAIETAQSEIIETATMFATEVDAFLIGLGLDREDFAVRLNRCGHEGPQERDDVFYVWVGARAVAPQANAADILTALHERWQQQGWDVHRYRQLSNGGINIAAREPGTGHAYSLDSGFEVGPHVYVAAFFNTPCFINPAGNVDFGPIDVDVGAPEAD